MRFLSFSWAPSDAENSKASGDLTHGDLSEMVLRTVATAPLLL